MAGKHRSESFFCGSGEGVWQMCISEPRTDSIWSSSKQLFTPR